MRNKIFISHATPDDDDFTKWLSLKLIGLGYEVWCDILFLDKGVDFWSNIEKEIRENVCKFLIVSSTAGNQREGVLKELAVATKVKKQLHYDTYIIPLVIDESLSYDDINIEIDCQRPGLLKCPYEVGPFNLISRPMHDHGIPPSSAQPGVCDDVVTN